MAKKITGQTKRISFTDTTTNLKVSGVYEYDIVNKLIISVNANYSSKTITSGVSSDIGTASYSKQFDNKLSKNYTLPTDTTIASELQQHFEALITEIMTEANS